MFDKVLNYLQKDEFLVVEVERLIQYPDFIDTVFQQQSESYKIYGNRIIVANIHRPVSCTTVIKCKPMDHVRLLQKLHKKNLTLNPLGQEEGLLYELIEWKEEVPN